MARLQIRRDDMEEVIPLTGDRLVIGRAPDCDVVIEDAASSRRHCCIERTSPASFRLKDLKSSNGTRLNGARVESAGGFII